MIEALAMTLALHVSAGDDVRAADKTTAVSDYAYRNPFQPTKNPKKIPNSTYRGFHYDKKLEPFRKCVMARESGGNYKANGRYGSGVAQWIQSTWDTYVERADSGYVGVRPHKAPPYLQEEVFWITLNPYPKAKPGSGKGHWSSKHAASQGFTIKDC